MFTWLHKTRSTRSPTGYWLHITGQWLAVGLGIYWWRAMLHLLDSVEAFIAGWRRSTLGHFGFIDGLIAIPVHLVSEPVYFLQLCMIVLVLYLTVNRQGYRTGAYVPAQLNQGGVALFAAILFLRR